MRSYIFCRKGSGGLSLSIRSSCNLFLFVFGENNNSLCRVGRKSLADFPRQHLQGDFDLFRIQILLINLGGDAAVGMVQYPLHHVRRRFVGGKMGGAGPAQIVRGPGGEPQMLFPAQPARQGLDGDGRPLVTFPQVHSGWQRGKPGPPAFDGCHLKEMC